MGALKTRRQMYTVWRSMIARCHNPAKDNYRYYGGKGILVCDRWRRSFEDFLLDMGYVECGMTLDRIDGSKGYSPENCRWATMMDQARNKSSNVIVSVNGESMICADAAAKNGLKKATVWGRLRRGWSDEDSCKPVAGNRKKRLSQSDAAMIYERCKSGEPYTAIATSYGISETHVGDIARGRSHGFDPLPRRRQ